jgi:hypothetical protein
LTKFDISKNNLRRVGTKALAEGLKSNQIMTELNISSNSMGSEGAIALADVIPGMGALTLLNMSANELKGAEAGKALGDAIAASTGLKELDMSGGEEWFEQCDLEFVMTFSVGLRDNGALLHLDVSGNNLGELVPPEGWTKGSYIYGDKYNWSHTDGRNEKGKPSGSMPDGVIALADAIPGMRALSKLVMRQNDIHGAEAGKAFSRMLAQNTVLKELDLSSQQVNKYHGNALDAAFAKEFAVGIRDNGAISTVIVNTFPLQIQDIKSKAELDFSGRGLEVEDVIIIAALIPSNVSQTIFPLPCYH